MISSYLLSSTFVPIMCVDLLKHMGHRARRKRGLFDRLLKVLSQGRGAGSSRLRWLVVPVYLVACGLVLVAAGLAGRHRAVPADRFGGIRAPVPAAARLELRADPADGGEVPRGDRARGEAREHRDHDGLRRPGRPELRHRQHGAVHARARRRPAARRPDARTAGSSSTSSASGSARSSPSG